MMPLEDHDANHLRHAMGLAERAGERGDRPFGAVLVAEDGRVLAEGQNSQNTDRDVTGHAETNVLREACRANDPETLAGATLYASGEPCAMCAGAIYWAGVGRVVYGASAARIAQISSGPDAKPELSLSCREVLAAGTRRTEVVGPALEREAERVFAGVAGRPTDAVEGGTPRTQSSLRELRVALTVENYDGAVALYGEGLGLPVILQWDVDRGRGTIFAAGAATIEIVDHAQADLIDEVEAGERVSGPVRLALGVADVGETARALRRRGAEVVNEPVLTPWGDFNHRLRTPDGMQLTLFRKASE